MWLNLHLESVQQICFLTCGAGVRRTSRHFLATVSTLTASASSSSDHEGVEELCKTLSLCKVKVVWKPCLQGGVWQWRSVLCSPILRFLLQGKTSVLICSWKEGSIRFPVCSVVRPPCFPFSFSSAPFLSSCCYFLFAMVALSLS